MADKLFNMVRQVQVFGRIIDGTGSIPLNELDRMEKRDNPSTNLQNRAQASKARKNNFYPKKQDKSLEELAEEIAKRGNDMQTTHSKDDIYEQLVSGVKQICEINGVDEVCIQRNGDQYYIFAVNRQEVDYLRVNTMNDKKQLSEQEQTVMKKLAEYTAKDKKVEVITAKDGTVICYETTIKRKELFRVVP